MWVSEWESRWESKWEWVGDRRRGRETGVWWRLQLSVRSVCPVWPSVSIDVVHRLYMIVLLNFFARCKDGIGNVSLRCCCCCSCFLCTLDVFSLVHFSLSTLLSCRTRLCIHPLTPTHNHVIVLFVSVHFALWLYLYLLLFLAFCLFVCLCSFRLPVSLVCDDGRADRVSTPSQRAFLHWPQMARSRLFHILMVLSVHSGMIHP